MARELQLRGQTVVMDRHQTTGLAWVQNLEAQIREGTLSFRCCPRIRQSEMLACEVEMADRRPTAGGLATDARPSALKGPLPEEIGGSCHRWSLNGMRKQDVPPHPPPGIVREMTED
jgi:hypothetical protein